MEAILLLRGSSSYQVQESRARVINARIGNFTGSSGRGVPPRRRRLIDPEELVGLDVIEVLEDAARPSDVDCIGDGVGAEAEVCPFVVRGPITAGGGDGDELRAVRGGELDLGANAVTVASMASQDERDPVVSASGLIAQNMCGSVIRSDDGIDAAVVVHVPDGHSCG